MRPCEKCLENNWKFEHVEDIVRATCQLCGYEVEFEPRVKQRPAVCKKCGGTLQKYFFKKHKATASYWFLWGWKCQSCHQIYNDEKAKVFPKK